METFVYKDHLSSATDAVCPKCGRKHKRTLNWTGRGVPRVYCARCRDTIRRGVWRLKQTKKLKKGEV